MNPSVSSNLHPTSSLSIHLADAPCYPADMPESHSPSEITLRRQLQEAVQVNDRWETLTAILLGAAGFAAMLWAFDVFRSVEAF